MAQSSIPFNATEAEERQHLARVRKTIGVICKTPAQSERVVGHLRDLGRKIHHLHAGSTLFSTGVVVATARLAKGLEFDQVVVPFCSEANYHTPVDRHMLYVACTRAMHKLTLTYTGGLSPFLTDPE